MKALFSFLPVLFLLLVCQPAEAQFAKTEFGKNRVQYKNFEWQYVTTENFEIYFYGENREVAELAARYAEADLNRVLDLIGFSPYNRIKVFVYNSVIDMQQSNIGVSKQGFAPGGQTNFLRPEAEVAFTGHKASFEKNIKLEVSKILITEMMYGGNLKDMFQSAYLLVLPEWFTAGAARYVAEGWSKEMDDYLRDAILNRKFKKIENLKGRDAEILGQSIWNYIGEEYGTGNIGGVLNLIRIIRNEKNSIYNTLGVQYPTFLREWRQFYEEQYKKTESAYQKPKDFYRLRTNPKNAVYNMIRLRPGQQSVAFSENIRGRYHVIVKDLTSGDERKIIAGGYKVINQSVNYNIPLIDWVDSERLAVVTARRGHNTLWIYDMKTKEKSRRKLEMFSHIEHIDISDDGNLMVMSAETKGQSDIYLYDLRDESISKITDDFYDDMHPAFLKNSSDVVYSTNRLSETEMGEKEEPVLAKRYNLMLYSAKEKTSRRLTNTYSNDLFSVAAGENSVIYCSDKRGIDNLYLYNIESGTENQISNYEYGVNTFDYQDGRLVYNMFFKGKPTLFFEKTFDIERSVFTDKTFRQQLLDVRRFQELRSERAAEKKDNPEEKEKPVKKDTVDTDNYRFDTIRKKKKSLLKDYNPMPRSEEGVLEEKPTTISAPRDYVNRFSADNVLWSLVIDPLRSWGLVLEVGLTDALENHKVNTGIFNVTNLNNSSYFVEYEYLRGRLDYRVRLDRSTLTPAVSNAFFEQRYALNKLAASVSYPINITSRFSAAVFGASTTFDVTSDIDPAVLAIPSSQVGYAGFNAEFVYDNSIVTGVNMFEGTKIRIKYENYFGLNTSGKNFGNLHLDARAYKRIWGPLTLAGRVSYGQFFGEAKKNYRLGGMDNWIFNKTDPVPSADPLYMSPDEPARDYSDLLFTRYQTNMRGFNYNKLYGNNFVLFNGELRLPLLNYFYKSSLTSNFFRHLQLVAFTDVGASWTGISPFNRENALNTVEVAVDPFYAKVSNFKNPFLVGYGYGVRTMLLGYYMKFDTAWGLEDGTVNNAKYYLTLGYDF